MTSVIREMRNAASRVKVRHFDALQSLGVPAQAIGNLSATQFSIGVERVEIDGGYYQPSPDGSPVLLIACCGPRDEWDELPLVDLIALRSDNPSRWWWRVGNAALLGEDAIANDTGEPLPVVATPIEWLALSGRAVCILDWSDASPAWALLRHGPSLTFSDEALRRKVSNALVRSAPLPKMELVA